MWPAFVKSIESNASQAEIVHDRFHISKHLNEAVDKVRRQENKALAKADDDRLKGTKQLWLFNPENISEDRWIEFETLKIVPAPNCPVAVEDSRAAKRPSDICPQFRWPFATPLRTSPHLSTEFL